MCLSLHKQFLGLHADVGAMLLARLFWTSAHRLISFVSPDKDLTSKRSLGYDRLQFMINHLLQKLFMFGSTTSECKGYAVDYHNKTIDGDLI